MKKTSFAVIILFIGLTSVKLFSQKTQIEQYSFLQNYFPKSAGLTEKIHTLNPVNLEYTDRLFPQHKFLNQSALNMNSTDSNVAMNETNMKTGRKSIWIGAGLSLLIPGAGEYYAKSYVKSAIFFGIELICWGSYIYFNHKGNTTTDDFEKFANSNWSIRQYARWLNDFFNGGLDPNDPDLHDLLLKINNVENENNFSHTLPDPNTNSQQYYEIIGKYQEYVSGWADAYVNGNWVVNKNNYYTTRTQMFTSYANERQQANNYYNDATTGAMVALVNHLISAADAAWSVSIFNKKLDVQTGMEIRTYLTPYTYQVKPLPTMNIKVSF